MLCFGNRLSPVTKRDGHPSGFKLLSHTDHLSVFKSRERGVKHFLYRASEESCRGIPARFLQEVMRDDSFAGELDRLLTIFLAGLRSHTGAAQSAPTRTALSSPSSARTAAATRLCTSSSR